MSDFDHLKRHHPSYFLDKGRLYAGPKPKGSMSMIYVLPLLLFSRLSSSLLVDHIHARKLQNANGLNQSMEVQVWRIHTTPFFLVCNWVLRLSQAVQKLGTCASDFNGAPSWVVCNLQTPGSNMTRENIVSEVWQSDR